ncbi:polyphosphate--glucose phosphotransferase [Christiangramia sabulilitoris]|uniref:ROK family protein n=1 Tax=Christiangramia sabulilitoris TaxID=2583991 RepID=A0A550I3A1_9FLAO|nr:ROK family protein [Christiangramia sabulilitoris]TRO65470.1 ROK family protein [Christiangramia sabulilitoris]
MEILGIDIGGSGIKGAIVNLQTGKISVPKFRIPTPRSREPEEMAQAVKKLVEHFNYQGIVGCGFPSIVKKGVCKDEGNLSKKWVGINIEELFEKFTGCKFTVINDADAAGLAEVKYGAGKDEDGFILMITVGTGLGSGAYCGGELIPNFELGQLSYEQYEKIEDYAASSVKKKENLSYEEWAERFNVFLNHIYKILNPDLILVGGGISKDWKQYVDYLNVNTNLAPAKLRNSAGILGAALSVKKKFRE